MSRFGIVSKHIVLTNINNTHPRYPCSGIILISGEIIEDIILLNKEIPFDVISNLYKDWELVDYSDLYVSPGIIDLNVRREYEDFCQLTKSALNGGVTVIAVEKGYYSPLDTSSKYYCDVAHIAIVNDQTNFEMIDKNICALKGYLFPPSKEIRSIAHLQNVMKEAFNSGLPFFIDATLPDPRMLYMASPSRLVSVDDRKDNESSSSGLFAAAFPENTRGSSESEDSEDEPVVPQRSISLECQELKKLGRPSGNLSDEESEKHSKLKEPSHMIIEAKECDECSPLKKTIRKKVLSYDIYNDLDNRIKASQQNIEDLCLAERSTYSYSGPTSFVSIDTPNKFDNLSIITPSHIEKSTESDSSEPNSGSSTTTPARKRELYRPSPIIIKPESRPDASRDYKYHLANLPEHWEISGVERVLESLITDSKIHFQNISSAGALNRVRQLKKTYKSITCEIPAVHLFFNSLEVKIGDTKFKNTPPIRNQGNFNLLWDLIKMKGIDSISSQHAYINSQRKNCGNFQQALNGIADMGCSLSAVWTMINVPVSSMEQLEHYIVRLAKWFSYHPAMILNICNKRGSIEKGKFADLVVWNPKEKFVVTSDYPYSETSPFKDKELFGSIKYVYLRGKLASNNDEAYFGNEISPEHYK
ncbi:hypothetical protein SteCoe_33411 [Stentor coeruleus]|uniref:Amidohydrolase-related domain-containing protein n=1 Tax=Stentor coeruleus TaxID=5963 RepID=A0A1R2AWR7_9CILI|nr:hypothetical protein SteCoe_33411 [Stentor coeruleus]